MNNNLPNSVSLHARRHQYRDVTDALALYTTTQDMADARATATPQTDMQLAYPTALAPARAPAPARARRSSLRSLRDVELAISNIQWPAGHPMRRARAISRSSSYSVTVHLSQHDLAVAARWDRIIGVLSTLALTAIFAKLMF
jgi:hypothetical protein